MPIREVSERPRIPIKGTIRLGVREEGRTGDSYPKTKEYFVLDDAPEVKKVYGDDPKELDIRFPGNDLNKVIPTWFKLWTPSLKKGNEIVQGRLLCQGDGPLDGAPGTAEWKDRNRMPVGDVLGPRDPKTGFVKRPCMGKECPDAFDGKGYPKCKQTMQVFCILPLVSFGDVYIISTSSWGSIRSFHNLLGWHQTAFNPDYIVFNYYKLAREEEAIRYFDKRESKEKDSVQYIMKLFHQDKEEFEAKYVDRLKNRQAQISAGSMSIYLPDHEEASQLPMDELYPMIEAPIVEEKTAEQLADVVAQDEEVSNAFTLLETAMGKKFPPKARQIAVLKKIKEPDVKAAVLAEINSKIEAMTKVKEPIPFVPDAVPLENIEVAIVLPEPSMM